MPTWAIGYSNSVLNGRWNNRFLRITIFSNIWSFPSLIISQLRRLFATCDDCTQYFICYFLVAFPWLCLWPQMTFSLANQFRVLQQEVGKKEFDHVFYVFWSLFLTLCHFFFRHFGQTPFARLLLRRGDQCLVAFPWLLCDGLEKFGDKFGESLGGSQAPPSFWEVPGLPRKFPKLPRKFFGDFPWSSLTVELNSHPEVPRKLPKLPRKFPKLPQKFADFPGGPPLSLGSLTPSPDSQKLSLKSLLINIGCKGNTRCQRHMSSSCVRLLKKLQDLRCLPASCILPLFSKSLLGKRPIL